MLAIAVAWAQPVSAGDVIDRIVALVNGQPVLLSDWQDRVRYQAMLDQRPLDQITPEQQQDALQQVIDQQLVEQQIRGRNVPPPEKEEVQSRLAELRHNIPGATTSTGNTSPGATSDDSWQNMLRRYGFTQDQVVALLEAQVRMVHFVTAEITPGVRVDNQTVLAYYRQNLVPKLRQSGQPIPPLEEVSADIRQILLQQKAGELLQEWLQSLRSQSEIHMLVPEAQPAGTTAVKVQ
jgi:hypothetical protein